MARSGLIIFNKTVKTAKYLLSVWRGAIFHPFFFSNNFTPKRTRTTLIQKKKRYILALLLSYILKYIHPFGIQLILLRKVLPYIFWPPQMGTTQGAVQVIIL